MPPVLLHATLVHAPTSTRIDILHNALIEVGDDGLIRSIETDVSAARVAAVAADLGVVPFVLSPSQMLLPGFVDTHLHAPQYAFTGTALDLPLLEWLRRHTFPCEARFADVEHARTVYDRCVRRTLRNGTTTAAYFATLHAVASCALVDIMRVRGQRGWVGKVCMTCHAPDDYIETEEQALQGTLDVIQYVCAMDAQGGSKAGLVEACVTPRFAPSCSAALLSQLGSLARQHQLPVQSHLSENLNEVAWVRELFPDADSYTDVYHAAGLLTPRTVMGHCVHLTAAERFLLRETGTSVSHCPISNFTLRSGVLNVRQLLVEGNKVGLGTDVSGGYSPSMLQVIRSAATASRVVQLQAEAAGESYPHLSTAELLHLATIGGAQAMGLQDKVGLFRVGMEFDALVVDTAVPDSPFDVFDGDSPMDMLEKFLFLGDDRNITHVFVRGMEVDRS